MDFYGDGREKDCKDLDKEWKKNAAYRSFVETSFFELGRPKM